MKAGLFVVSSLIVGLFILASQAVEARAQETDLEAPSGLTQLGPILSWIDNSTTEDGFKINVRLLSAAGLPEKIFNFEVAAGVTSYTLPGEARMSW